MPTPTMDSILLRQVMHDLKGIEILVLCQDNLVLSTGSIM